MKKTTKTLNIDFIIKSEESMKESIFSFIEISWNHMIPIVSAIMVGKTQNPWYILGILIPLLFQIKLFNEDD